MKKLIYNPNPEPVLEPLFERHSLDEVEWSDLYEVTCNGEKQPVFYTDSFHYAPVAVGVENNGIDVEIVRCRFVRAAMELRFTEKDKNYAFICRKL